MIVTFVLALIGWVIFRAETLGDSISYLSGICSYSLLDFSTSAVQLADVDDLDVALSAIIVMMLAEWLQRDKQHALQFSPDSIFAKSIILRYVVYVVLTMSLIGLGGSQSEFIYFQF